jgi:hypothetical protein
MSTLNFEVGKTYMTRDGRKVICLSTTLREGKIAFQINGEVFISQPNGMYYADESKSLIDIIGEWIDKPVIDWSLMPAWAKFVAMDKSGKWYIHTSEPLIDEEFYFWKAKSDSIYSLIPTEYAPKWEGDWRKSLIERP